MKTIKAHWENIYKTRDHKKVGWFQESPDISLKLLAKINAQPSLALIDVGCGVSTLVDHLIKQTYKNITLLDLSSEALSTVKSRLGNKGDNKGDIPKYLNMDITKLKYNKCFDIWHDRAVFHFLTNEADRNNYMLTLEQSLSAKGHAIIGTFSLNGPVSCSGLEIVQYDEKKMSTLLPKSLKLIYSTYHTHIMPSGKKQQYRYFIIRRDNP